MKIFHELVFDEFMEGNTTQYRARMHWWPVMGNVDTLRFYGVADYVSTAVDLNWTLYDVASLDTTHLHQVKAFTAVPLSAGQTKQFQSSVSDADAGMPASYGYILLCSLSAAAKAHVRIWVTGRGRA